MYCNYKFLLFISLLFLAKCANEKVCRNPKGTAVDWYVIFFMPKSASSDGEIHYGYFDNISSSLKYYLYEESTFPP